MPNKVCQLLLSTLALLFAANTYAAHLTVTLGDDIVANNDSISFSTSKSYQHNGSTIVISDGELVAEGIKLKNFPEFLTAINSMLRTAPGPSDYNAFSLGYIKNGTKVWPASCQNIPLALETSVNLNESGCIVL